jgi:hypothetical protein
MKILTDPPAKPEGSFWSTRRHHLLTNVGPIHGGQLAGASANLMHGEGCAGALNRSLRVIIGVGKIPPLAPALSLVGREEPTKSIVHKGAAAVQFLMHRLAGAEFKEDR